MLRSGSVVRFQKLAADGRKVIELVQGPQMLALGEVLALARYESTCETTSAAEVVATHPFCENAALVYGKRAFTVQAHPEFADAFVDGLMKTRGKGLVPDALMAAATARLGQPNSSAAVADRIAAFFKQNEG